MTGTKGDADASSSQRSKGGSRSGRNDLEPKNSPAAADDVVGQLIRQVCSALYERQHSLQRAFTFLDPSGSGYLKLTEFEQAISLVMTYITPSGHESEATDNKQVNESQVSALVTSLAGSSLLDAKGEQIDYVAFIKAFEVIDTEPEGLY
uniref:EF-hand domain-containing protein n=1 Tax=Haptolina brevifila TaxID=156173 RepID=A0A7S2MU66_9EUKA